MTLRLCAVTLETGYKISRWLLLFIPDLSTQRNVHRSSFDMAEAFAIFRHTHMRCGLLKQRLFRCGTAMLSGRMRKILINAMLLTVQSGNNPGSALVHHNLHWRRCAVSPARSAMFFAISDLESRLIIDLTVGVSKNLAFIIEKRISSLMWTCITKESHCMVV